MPALATVAADAVASGRLPAPRLFVTTTRLSDDAAARLRLNEPGGLLATLAGHDDVVSWVRQGQGMVGIGRALTLTACGKDRVATLRAAWRATVYASWWRDPLVRPGTGPVAFGTITFSAQSALSSVLVVPRILLGRDEQGAWVTCAAGSEQELATVQDALAQLTAGDAVAGAAAPSAYPDLTAATGEASLTTGPSDAVVEPGRSETDYLTTLARVQARMRSGEAAKVVIARDVLVRPRTPVRVDTLLSRLAVAYPSCWTFAVDGMVGASPELLVRLAGRRLASRVLAGTARRQAGTPAEREAEAVRLTQWLERSGKNNREHELARASAISALEPLCSVVEAPPRYVLSLPNVLHLASDVSGVVAGDTGALSLVGALHPTAAVGGTPTHAAVRVIAEEEGMDRGRYAGPVGWVDWHGEGEWCIALRSGQMSAPAASADHPVRVFGGGGIMPDSVPTDELAETRAKMRPMLGALGVEP